MKKSITDNTKGAVFVSWDTGKSGPMIWPAKYGITKYRGCIEYWMADKNAAELCGRKWRFGASERLTQQDAQEEYGDCPEPEEAWLVKPDPGDPKNFWLWERVDTQLKLLP